MSLIITVGIPGSGKSTWTEKMLPRTRRVTADDIRAELCGDASDQSKNDLVFKLFHLRLVREMVEGRDVIADSTALTPSSRKDLRDLARIFRADVHLVYFSNVEQACLRNLQRERVVPADAMDRMLDRYEKFRMDLPTEAREYASVTEIASVG